MSSPHRAVTGAPGSTAPSRSRRSSTREKKQRRLRRLSPPPCSRQWRGRSRKRDTFRSRKVYRRMYVDLQKVKTKYLSLSYVRYVASSPCLPLVSLLRYSYLRTDVDPNKYIFSPSYVDSRAHQSTRMTKLRAFSLRGNSAPSEHGRLPMVKNQTREVLIGLTKSPTPSPLRARPPRGTCESS